MIVCSCNVLSDQDVRSAVEAQRTRSTRQAAIFLDSIDRAQTHLAATVNRVIRRPGINSAHLAT
jgi:hypothetical protein